MGKSAKTVSEEWTTLRALLDSKGWDISQSLPVIGADGLLVGVLTRRDTTSAWR